ncbi:hypothetical protein CK203_040295 [Vitis vinifera]|uniref:Uncharacterized protein n=1 Tax=Vitis vinifera TaxID=29760 RepID=A0A438HXG1_VITVI|nr:hypothetical protein CK203_040295 [Vitis vinifera]
MARIRGGHIDPSVSREARPSAFLLKIHLRHRPFHLLRVGYPLTLLSARYSTRRPPTSPPPEPSVHRIPPKRARTLGLGETSKHAQPDSQAPTDS